jgi:hypothetical protein
MNPSLSTGAPTLRAAAPPVETILGVRYLVGDAGAAVAWALGRRGLVVAPSGPNLATMDRDPAYARAVMAADLAVTDSGLMLALWAVSRGRLLPRVSGLGFLRALLAHADFARERTLWVVPGEREGASIRSWLTCHGLQPGSNYVAPMYARGPGGSLTRNSSPRSSASGPAASFSASARRPGKAGPLAARPPLLPPGHHLHRRRDRLHHGRASQHLPRADRWALGWLLRCLRDPRRFVPRYAAALRLVPLLLRWASGRPARSGK